VVQSSYSWVWHASRHANTESIRASIVTKDQLDEIIAQHEETGVTVVDLTLRVLANLKSCDPPVPSLDVAHHTKTEVNVAWQKGQLLKENLPSGAASHPTQFSSGKSP
jgi:hypothetical protein